MIDVEYNDEVFQMKNKLSEITIEELEYIMFTLSRTDKNIFTKWMDIMIVLHLNPIVVDNMELDSFLKLSLAVELNTDLSELTKEIEIDGVIYSLYQGEKFSLKMKELKAIESLIEGSEFYFCKLCAALYKCDSKYIVGTPKEHNDMKIEFFKNQPASIVVPILNIVNQTLIKKINLIISGGIN